MRKIMIYECKRLLWNKFFFGILFILLFYGWQVLNNVTILGVSYTAPFSPWSFGDYLSRIIPLLWIGTLFFLTFFTSGKARHVAVLTEATQMPSGQYVLARCAAALAATGLLVLSCLAEAAVFYGKYFGWYDWGNLLIPALIFLVPLLVFALGSGLLLGQIKPWIIYVWMLFPFFCLAIALPEALGLWNGSFFTDYPLTLGILDPSFSIPVSVFCGQCFLFLAGIILLIYQYRKQSLSVTIRI